MDDFDTPGQDNAFNLKPSASNNIEPGKRPMSSMSPIIVLDEVRGGEVRLVLGASGGSKIISSIAQVAVKNLHMDTDLKAAINARRVHHQLSPEYLEIESEFPAEIELFLRAVGNEARCFNFGGSSVQAVARYAGSSFISAYSDPRKGGTPDGL
jgi:gamma-glutamyltranspeptidase/glutathione hydrolase/leukotriene-C4 hydrolase